MVHGCGSSGGSCGVVPCMWWPYGSAFC